MLRITVKRNSGTATLKLAGRLAGPWIDELDRTWNELHMHTLTEGVVLDLSEVTFVAPEPSELIVPVWCKTTLPSIVI